MGEIRRQAGIVIGSSFPAFAMVYAALFCAFGLESPFLPAFFADRGLSSSAIGIVLASATTVRLAVGPVFGRLADRYDATKWLLSLTALGGSIFSLGYLVGSGFWQLLAVAMIHSAVIAPLNPFADTLTLTASAREKVFAYGWVRGIGSAVFIVGTLVSGELVARYGLSTIILSSSLLFLLLALATIALPAAGAIKKEKQSPLGIRALFAIPVFRRLLLVAGLIMGSHAMSDTFAVIHWRAEGIGPRAVSFLWSEAVVAEVVVFFLIGPRLLRAIGPGRCLALSAGAGILRWSLFAASSSLYVLATAQLLHGFTFALLHLACMRLIFDSVPIRLLATAQSIYGTLCLGLGSAAFTLASGPLYQRFGAQAFWLMAALCILALPFSLTMPKVEIAREASADP